MNKWIVIWYNNGKRTVIGVENVVAGEKVVVHNTTKTQWHAPTDSPGGVDVALLQYMQHAGVTKLVNQTYGLEITLPVLQTVPVKLAAPIQRGPFLGQSVLRVFAPRSLWLPSTIREVTPARRSDEITLDELGNVWSTGVDTSILSK